MSYETLVRSIYPLPDAALGLLEGKCVPVPFEKGQALFSSGTTVPYLYFIAKGMVRAYDDNEVTFWLGNEHSVVFCLNSYLHGSPGYESVEALEDTLTYRVGLEDLRSLYSTDLHWANWGRVLAEKEFYKTEKRFISRQWKSARERYEELLEEQPELLQRVPLGIIASYLGITQVSLSRIRAEMTFYRM